MARLHSPRPASVAWARPGQARFTRALPGFSHLAKAVVIHSGASLGLALPLTLAEAPLFIRILYIPWNQIQGILRSKVCSWYEILERCSSPQHRPSALPSSNMRLKLQLPAPHPHQSPHAAHSSHPSSSFVKDVSSPDAAYPNPCSQEKNVDL